MKPVGLKVKSAADSKAAGAGEDHRGRLYDHR
jgi:hypothetical protein